MKNKFKAYTETEFGGTGYRRAKTLDEAIAKAKSEPNPKSISGKEIAIVSRWVETNTGEVVWKA